MPAASDSAGAFFLYMETKSGNTYPEEKNQEQLWENGENEMKVSRNLEENERYIREQCVNCADIILRPMMLGADQDRPCLIVYIEAAVSNMLLQDSVIGKLLNRLCAIPGDEIADDLLVNASGISDMAGLDQMEDAVKALLAGDAVFFIEGYEKAVKIGVNGYPNMGVQKTESEKVLRGSKEGFTDSVKVNTALIRKRIRSTGLKVEEVRIGVRSDTVVALVYEEELMYPQVLKTVKTRISEFEIDGILDSGMLEQLTEENWRSPFPEYEPTERPDRAAMEILNGRLVILCDNSPVALIAPAAFSDFLKSGEDPYNRFELVAFQRMIRYGAALVALMISGVYLAVIGFHTQVLPTNLLLSFAEARRGVPFPSLIEILLMELAFELIREAGVRMPGPLGGTIGIVGGLIIGDAAVSANLVSPMAVVIVALSALASFAIPNDEFSSAFRLLKYGFIFLGGLLGIFGLVLGGFLLIGHLSGLTSFQIPYLMPYVAKEMSSPLKEDGVWKGAWKRMRYRPVYARREQRVRLRKMGDSNVRR